MGSNVLWSTPRRHLKSPLTQDSPNLSAIALNATPGSADNVASALRTRPHTASQHADVKTSPLFRSLTLGRPCVAGTQTSRHQANLSIDNRVMDNADLADLSTTRSFIQDSSGLGSLLMDSHNIDNSTPSCSGIGDQDLWMSPCQALSGVNDGDDDRLGRLELGEIQQVRSSGERAGYVNTTETTKVVNRHSETSSATSFSQTEHSVCHIGDSGVCNDSSNSSFSVSAHDSKMLDENLASVARYVEELTGCATTSGTKPTNPEIAEPVQLSFEHLPEGLITEVYATLARRLQQQHQSTHSQLRQLTQLQQLNQLLATLVARKSGRQGPRVIADSLSTHGINTRLSAIQYPHLSKINPTLNQVMNSVISNSHTSHVVSQTPVYLHQNNSHIQDTQHIDIENGISSCHGSLQACLKDGLTSHSQLPRNTKYTPLMDQEIDNLTATAQTSTTEHQDVLSRNVLAGIPTSLIQMPHFNEPEAQISHLTEQCAATSVDAISMIANHLGMGQKPEVVPGHFEGQNEVSQTAASKLNFLLTSLHEHGKASNINDLATHSTLLMADGRDTHPLTNRLQPSPTSNLCKELTNLAAPYQRLLSSLELDIDRAADIYRNSAGTIAQKSEVAYHWSGKLPVRSHRSMNFSRKVFLGGVPWDSTTEDLLMAFARFGNVLVSWPQQDSSHLTSICCKSTVPRGYCYLIFEHESSVSELIASCIRDPATGGDYYKISSATFKSKDVQVIPWVISDSQYTKAGPYRPDSKRTVFVGALHGMITAEALVTIMNDLFGNVVFAALDTDKYKYPIGSGRVAFSNYKSYMRAVTANFVDVRTPKFVKTIQIDPYLEDSLCNTCTTSPGIYFCRAFECFRYFCPVCWQLWHSSTETLCHHKPLRRTFKLGSDRSFASVLTR